MKRLACRILLSTTAVALLWGCQPAPTTDNAQPSTPDSAEIVLTSPPLRDQVLTADEQKALSPDTVLAQLMAGNARFVANDLTARDHSAMVRKAAAGQYPKAVILSCLDSRVPVEDVFNEGIGDLFVGRVAGSVVNEDLLGSMEFGCRVAGAKLIVVLGHTSCGAVKAAIDNVQLGNITSLVNKLRPAYTACQDFNGEKKSKNDDFVTAVTEKSVLQTMETIRSRSTILRDMEANGEIKIVGAMYDLNSGMVRFL